MAQGARELVDVELAVAVAVVLEEQRVPVLPAVAVARRADLALDELDAVGRRVPVEGQVVEARLVEHLLLGLVVEERLEALLDVQPVRHRVGRRAHPRLPHRLGLRLGLRSRACAQTLALAERAQLHLRAAPPRGLAATAAEGAAVDRQRHRRGPKSGCAAPNRGAPQQPAIALLNGAGSGSPTQFPACCTSSDF